jgi:predicted AAA+ superfamily ATPase
MGARQTGKTTLLKKIVNQQGKVLWLSADEPAVIALFEGSTPSRLKALFYEKK